MRIVSHRSNVANALHRKAARAFTLIEMLLVLCLIGLVAGVTVISANAIFSGLGDTPVPDLLQSAVREARYQAAAEKEASFLIWDKKRQAFLVTNEEMQMAARRTMESDDFDENAEEPVIDYLAIFESGYEEDFTGLAVEFHKLLPLPAGTPGNDYYAAQMEEVPRVVFHPDRSSTPFEARITLEGVETRHRFDPFSDVEVKIAE